MTRIAIDHDADGAFAVITRPGAAAERIPLLHRDAVRLMSEAAQVVLVVDRSSYPVDETSFRRAFLRDQVDTAPPHFIGVLGE